jgi:excisionase family DNA binding protein
MEDRLLNSVQQVCARTGLGRSSIYELMQSGQLTSVRVGRRRLVPESALADFLDRLTKAATS